MPLIFYCADYSCIRSPQICFVCRRPSPRTVADLGMWDRILTFFVLLSVAVYLNIPCLTLPDTHDDNVTQTNVGTFGSSSHAPDWIFLSTGLIDEPACGRNAAFFTFAVEHIVGAIVIAILLFVSNEPGWVRMSRAKDMFNALQSSKESRLTRQASSKFVGLLQRKKASLSASPSSSTATPPASNQ